MSYLFAYSPKLKRKHLECISKLQVISILRHLCHGSCTARLARLTPNASRAEWMEDLPTPYS